MTLSSFGFLLGTVDEMCEITVAGMYIPEQAGERDKVGQTSEEPNIALLNVCERNNVKVVGWVHSHPTFDAYLSSVDRTSTECWAAWSEECNRNCFRQG